MHFATKRDRPSLGVIGVRSSFGQVIGIGSTYLALPGQVVGLESAVVEWDEEVGAAVSVWEGQFRIAHLLAGSLYNLTSANACPGVIGR